MTGTQFPYIQQLARWVRRGYESFIVIDGAQLDENCLNIRQHYPPNVRHLYDLQTLPTLAVVQVIHDQLRCKVVIPTPDWASYTRLANIPDSDVWCLREEACWIASIEEWTQLHQACDPTLQTAVCIPHAVLSTVVQCAPVEHMKKRHMQWVVDARGASAEEQDVIADSIRRFSVRHGIRCWVMHGEGLFHQACTLWLTVRSVKQVHGRRYAILSGGTNMLWDAGQRGNAFRKKYSIVFLQSNAQETNIPTTFCGPLCTPQDMLAVDISAPALHPGDLMAVPDVGTAHYRSPLYFISHPVPLEMLYVEGALAPIQQIPHPHLSTDSTVQ